MSNEAATDCAGVVFDWWQEARARAEKAEAEVDRLKELLTNYYTEDQRSFTGVSGATQRAVEKALWPDEDEADA